jgi:hypothetical protein
MQFILRVDPGGLMALSFALSPEHETATAGGCTFPIFKVVHDAY